MLLGEGFSDWRFEKARLVGWRLTRYVCAFDASGLSLRWRRVVVNGFTRAALCVLREVFLVEEIFAKVWLQLRWY
jgi:hypothetical protein